MPLVFSFGLCGMGLVFLASSATIAARPHPRAPAVADLTAVFVCGLVLRFMLLGSAPVLEADFNRYLWDGAITASGSNPYAIAPAEVANLPYDDLRLELSKASGDVFAGITYPDIRTIYPPVAQAAFALNHVLAPWSLTGWRLLCLATDTASFFLLLALLRHLGRPALAVALYWLNPLVLKEIGNSAHTEALLVPLLLGGVLLAIRGRHVACIGVISLAAGVKLWPVLLAPILLRPLLLAPRRLAAAVVLLVGLLSVQAVPVLVAQIDGSSGFVRFANEWATNSALFFAIERLAAVAVPAVGGFDVSSGLVARAVCVAAVIGVVVWQSCRPLRSAHDLVARLTAVAGAVVLLSPAQFPWYVLWVLPLALLQPGYGWQVAAALLPIYYTAFYFHARGTYAIYETYVVWLIWLPVWATLLADVWRRNSSDKAQGGTAAAK